jgi:hypothetical protein
MSEDYLEQKRIEIDNLIHRNKFKNIFTVFTEVKNNVADQITFYNFVGNTFVKHYLFFVIKFFKTYNRNIVNLLNPEDVFKMERHILQTYCLYPNERLIISFNGQYLLGSVKEVGRLHLTTDRIIFQGSIKSTGVTKATGSYLQGAINKNIRKKILNKTLPTDLPCFGYPHSILGFTNVRLVGNQVILKVPYGKIKIHVFGDARLKVAKVVYETIIEANNIDS